MTSVVQGLGNVSKYPDLTAELLRRGCTDQGVKKILGLNVLRDARRGAGLSRAKEEARAVNRNYRTT